MAGSLHPCFPASLPHEGQGSLKLASLPLAGPAPATPAFVFPKDPRELDEAQSGTSRIFCGGNSCDVHMDEETPRGDDRLNYYPRCQGKGEEGLRFLLPPTEKQLGQQMKTEGGEAKWVV